MATDKETGKSVAIKAVDIERVCEYGKEKHVMREKDLLFHLKNKNEHVIKLLTTFKVSDLEGFYNSYQNI